MTTANYELTGGGMQRVFESEKWAVGVKSWKPTNDIMRIGCLEHHNKTDELFMLMEGSCTLIYTNGVGGGLAFGAIKMGKDKVHDILSAFWHNTITQRDTKMILIKDSSTSMENGDILNLDAAQIEGMRSL